MRRKREVSDRECKEGINERGVMGNEWGGKQDTEFDRYAG